MKNSESAATHAISWPGKNVAASQTCNTNTLAFLLSTIIKTEVPAELLQSGFENTTLQQPKFTIGGGMRFEWVEYKPTIATALNQG